MVASMGSIMPEPLAMPPTAKLPADVWTRTALSFGHGSVVMMACAASTWPGASVTLDAAAMPAVTAAGSSATPITPVDATSTSSTAQPIARAVSPAMTCATSMPASPVQALAQPLLTTMPRARPPTARDGCGRGAPARRWRGWS